MSESIQHISTDDPAIKIKFRWVPFTFFSIILLLSALAWMGGGSQSLNDICWILITLGCLVFSIMELWQFTNKFSLGALTFYGGSLAWFCYNYFDVLFGQDPSQTGYEIEIISKATFYHALFFVCVLIGIYLPTKQIPNYFAKIIPQVKSPNTYMIVLGISLVVGLIPFIFFTQETFFVALYHEIIGGRIGGTAWTVGRTGSINYSWSGYIAHLLDFGQVGSILGMFYCILVSRNPFHNLICIFIWLFWLALAFGSGTRGEVAFLALPVVGLLFFKYHIQTAHLLRKISIKAYVISLVIFTAVLLLIQIQAYFRMKGFEDVHLETNQVVELQGNHMFTASLLAFTYIPEKSQPFYARYTGEPLTFYPRWVFKMITHPIPRALWTSKPISESWVWYSELTTGRRMQGKGYRGTTIAPGIVGGFYLRYGLAGVIQGSLLFGWILGLLDRLILLGITRPLLLLLTFGLLTWMFRNFRGGLAPSEFWQLMVGYIPLCIFVYYANLFSANR